VKAPDAPRRFHLGLMVRDWCFGISWTLPKPKFTPLPSQESAGPGRPGPLAECYLRFLRAAALPTGKRPRASWRGSTCSFAWRLDRLRRSSSGAALGSRSGCRARSTCFLCVLPGPAPGDCQGLDHQQNHEEDAQYRPCCGSGFRRRGTGLLTRAMTHDPMKEIPLSAQNDQCDGG